MTDVNALGQVAGTLMVLLVALGLYVWTALALAGVFGKVGEERWQGWVPVWNTAVLLRIGGYSPWLVLLALVPVLGAVALAVVLVMAFHRINTGFGYGAGMTVVAALWTPIWASVLAWGAATWSGGSVRPATQPAWQPPQSAPAWAPPARPSPVVPVEAGVSSLVGRAETPGPARDGGVAAAEARIPASPDPGQGAQAFPAAEEADEGRTPVPPPAGPRQWFPVPPPGAGADVAEVGASEPSPVLSPTGPLSATDPLSIGNWLTDTAAVTQWAGSEPSGSVAAPEPAPDIAPRIEPSPQPPVPEPAAEPAAPDDAPAPTDDLRWAPPPEVFRAAPGVFGAAAPTALPLEPAPPAPSGVSPEIAAEAVPLPEEPEGPEELDVPEEFDDRTVLASRLRPRWRLLAVTGEEFVLTGTEVLVGRLPAPDPAHPGAQVLPVSDTTRTVSKAHALLTLVDGRWLVSDLGSTNGVTLVAADGSERTIGPGTAVPLTGRFFLGDAEFALREVPPGS